MVACSQPQPQTNRHYATTNDTTQSGCLSPASVDSLVSKYDLKTIVAKYEFSSEVGSFSIRAYNQRSYNQRSNDSTLSLKDIQGLYGFLQNGDFDLVGIYDRLYHKASAFIYRDRCTYVLFDYSEKKGFNLVASYSKWDPNIVRDTYLTILNHKLMRNKLFPKPHQTIT